MNISLSTFKQVGFLSFCVTLIVACGTGNNNETSSIASSSSQSSPPSEPAHTSCPSETAQAYNNSPGLIPGRVEVEDFDPNGYMDSSDENEGGAYRLDSAVDVKSIASGHAVGWMTSGEWLEYTVNVPTAGNYTVTIRSGAVGAGRTLGISQCGDVLLSDIAVPNVSEWGQFKTWEAGTIPLTAGLQKIRLNVGSVDFLDVDWLHIGPYSGTIDPPDPERPTFPDFFVGNITTSGQVRSDFVQFWGQITPENEGKWGSVESTRDNYNWSGQDRAYEYAKQNGIPFKAHTLVWGSQRPDWIDDLSAAEKAEEIEEWIRDYCERYPETELIDVVNESTPGHAPAEYARDAFGNDWIIRSFQLARQYCPKSILILNDYNVLSWNTNEFIEMARPAVNAGVVDAIGLQSHGLESWSLSDISGKLNQVADLGLPIYISEYDVASNNDQEQLRILQEQFQLFYNHPQVVGITLWGYVVGRTWIDGTGLINDDGSFRPAMTWLMDYIQQNPK